MLSTYVCVCLRLKSSDFEFDCDIISHIALGKLLNLHFLTNKTGRN